MNDLISRHWLLDCVNESWVKFDTEKDKNTFIHLVRDIAPPAQITLYGYSIEYLNIIAKTMHINNVTPEEANYILKDIQFVVGMLNKEYEKMLRKNTEDLFDVLGRGKDAL